MNVLIRWRESPGGTFRVEDGLTGVEEAVIGLKKIAD